MRAGQLKVRRVAQPGVGSQKSEELVVAVMHSDGQLFAAAHLGNPGENPLGIASVFLIGVIFATAIWLTGNPVFAVMLVLLWIVYRRSPACPAQPCAENLR
jgi:hypothetical protein